MKLLNVTFVINVTTEAELPNTPLPSESVKYLRVSIKDNREADIQQYFHQVADLIEQVDILD
jgi:atypical dual specificity phosphatase